MSKALPFMVLTIWMVSIDLIAQCVGYKGLSVGHTISSGNGGNLILGNHLDISLLIPNQEALLFLLFL